MFGGRQKVATSILVSACGLTAAVASAVLIHTDEVSAAPPAASAVKTATNVSAVSTATATPAPVPSGPPNTIEVAGLLDVSVGTYTDCTGKTELTHTEAAVDTCVSGATYFVGHNPGVFTPLFDLGVGSLITYYDADGVAHDWQVVSVRTAWVAADGIPPVTEPDVVAQFQTCAVPDGSIDRILDVVQA